MTDEVNMDSNMEVVKEKSQFGTVLQRSSFKSFIKNTCHTTGNALQRSFTAIKQVLSSCKLSNF